jgi:hypothetical protein
MKDVDEVGRMFRRLVEVLATQGRVHDFVLFPELYEKIIPYRSNRTSLQFDSNQDYEMTLLRLLSGEQGFVEVDPPEVATILSLEARSINPDPAAFRRFDKARAKLSREAVRGILAAHDAYAPPVEQLELPPAVEERMSPPPRVELAEPEPTAAPAPAVPLPEECPQCTRKLPSGRAINFCPHCGGNVKVRDCPQCGTQLELDWRHCVTCGYRVT